MILSATMKSVGELLVTVYVHMNEAAEELVPDLQDRDLRNGNFKKEEISNCRVLQANADGSDSSLFLARSETNTLHQQRNQFALATHADFRK